MLIGRRHLLLGLGTIALAPPFAGAAEPPDRGEAVPPPAAADPADAVVGSAAVLAALWTREKLAGRDEDRRIRRQRPPDRAAPHLPAAAVLPPVAADRAGSIRRVKPAGPAKPVALTFDLCERADDITGYDGAVVDVLRREQVPATFFAGGKWLRSHPERAAQLIADPLFEIGNHAWTHGNFRVLAQPAAEQQILWTQGQYALLRAELARRAAAAGVAAAEIALLPPVPRVFRFPYGTCTGETLAMAARLGLAAIQWDVISGDAVAGATAASLEKGVLAAVRPGSIAVFHANGRGSGTAAALPAIIATLRQRGFRFVTVSTLLAAGEPVAASSCYELRPNDNGRYDRLFGEGTG